MFEFLIDSLVSEGGAVFEVKVFQIIQVVNEWWF